MDSLGIAKVSPFHSNRNEGWMVELATLLATLIMHLFEFA